MQDLNPLIRGRLVAISEVATALEQTLANLPADALTPLETARALVAVDGLARDLERLSDHLRKSACPVPVLGVLRAFKNPLRT